MKASSTPACPRTGTGRRRRSARTDCRAYCASGAGRWSGSTGTSSRGSRTSCGRTTALHRGPADQRRRRRRLGRPGPEPPRRGSAAGAGPPRTGPGADRPGPAPLRHPGPSVRPQLRRHAGGDEASAARLTIQALPRYGSADDFADEVADGMSDQDAVVPIELLMRVNRWVPGRAPPEAVEGCQRGGVVTQRPHPGGDSGRPALRADMPSGEVWAVSLGYTPIRRQVLLCQSSD